jgi:predicted DNA-binding transcriptional regulator AlpA
MPMLIDYPSPLLTTQEVLAILRMRNRGSLRRMIREEGFPRASVRNGHRGQLFRASLVDDWLRRQEKAAGI